MTCKLLIIAGSILQTHICHDMCTLEIFAHINTNNKKSVIIKFQINSSLLINVINAIR